MVDIPLNNSPDLSMEEITKLLFNNEFMSDIQFRVEEKVLYGHSWEVMKRSVVFRQQFRTNLGENKLIPIEDVKYEAFYQFLRFIYTDEIDIKDHLISDVLKLAVRYKIVKLETKVLNTAYSTNDPDLKLFEFGVLNNFELCRNHVLNNIYRCFNKDDLKGITFLNMHSNTFEEILKSNIGFVHLSEADLFNGLVLWINYSCEKNKIPLTQRRSHFDKLIRLIRFSTMTIDVFRLCLQQHPDILTNDDIGATMRSNLLCSIDATNVSNIKSRLKYQSPWVWKKHPFKSELITKFRVLDDLILRGIRFGAGATYDKNNNIQYSSMNCTVNINDVISLKYVSNLNIDRISFGDSIKLIPNFEYSIKMGLSPPKEDPNNENNLFIRCRKPNISTIITGPTELVTLMETSENLIEIIFDPYILKCA